MIPLFKSNYGKQEVLAAAKVVEGGWLSMGENVQEFESRFCELLGSGMHCFSTTNCTMSLFLAMQALEIGPGDEVLVPGLTFVSDANVVRMCGATPVFIDITSEDNLNVSIDDLKSKITAKTKACIVVHFAGFACDMDEIMRLCNAHGISVVEDCAHAPGATYRETALGSIGAISCFSFYSNKNLSTGEGGMVCTGDEKLALKLSRLRAHGMTKPTLDRKLGRTSFYDIVEPSLNSRLDEIRAAIGLVQLDRLTDGNSQRKTTFNLYVSLFEGTSIAVPFSAHELGDSSYHIMVVLLPDSCDRQALTSSLLKSEIQTSLHYRPFWTFTAYSDLDPGDTPMLSSIHERLLTLPLSPGFSADEISKVANITLKTISEQNVE